MPPRTPRDYASLSRRRPRRLVAAGATAVGAAAALLCVSSCGVDPQGGPGGNPPSAPGGTSAPASASPSAPATYSDYVALGDSYAAVGGTTLATDAPPFCRRAAANYPALLLQGGRVESGTDATCQGASIPDLTEPRPTGEDSSSGSDSESDVGANSATLPPQVSALSPATDLVTLSIGGNDIDFGAIAGCFGRSMLGGGESACRAGLAQRTDAALGALPAQLDSAYEAIEAAAPRATIVATGYIPLIAPADSCTEISRVSPDDREWAVELTARLNALVREGAERHGARFAEPAAAERHSACADPQERWVDFSGTATGSFPMHPTPLGHEAMAAAVNDVI